MTTRTETSFLTKLSSGVIKFVKNPWVQRSVLGLFILGVVAVLAVVIWAIAITRDLPSEKVLAEYNPEVTTRVHAGDGKLIAEFATEHRIYVPYEGIPDHVVHAFVSAEDKNFFEHGGLDYFGIAKAAVRNVVNKVTGSGGLQGASTITQQVVKNMVLEDNTRALDRKVREAVLAWRVEDIFTKEKILEFYLNEIELGGRSHGVASAALRYFNKSLPELSLEEAAVLAAMPKAPSALSPFTNPEGALARRNYVIRRMAINGYITDAEAEEALAKPLETTPHFRGEEYDAARYFVEELRRNLISDIGEEAVNAEGLSIRSTLDTRLQLAAQTALRDGLEAYDRRMGYRGPLGQISLGEKQLEVLAEFDLPGGYGEREAALVVSSSTDAVSVQTIDGFELSLSSDDLEWSRTFVSESGDRGVNVGDVILASVVREVQPNELLESDEANEELALEEPQLVATDLMLAQLPEVEGALLALDPHTGRILAMAGGYSFWKNQFNRTTQARRQPGSSFKPLVYAAAMEMGDLRTGTPLYTPSSRVLDAPFVHCDYTRVEDQCWSPSNYTSGRFYGMSTLRLGLEMSRNAMTARLAQDIGMEPITEFSRRIGLYDDLPPYLSMSLGAGEVTMFDLAKAYALLVNGGKKVTPTLFDRVQGRTGETLFRFDERECVGCNEEFTGQAPPVLADEREQVIDPIIAFQTAHMLQGVVERGTAAGIRRECPRGGPQAAAGVEDVPTLCAHSLAGKTGTTNDYIDGWFMGFSPDLVVGVYVGYDEPKSLGDGESGGRVAAPIFGNFMNEALKGRDPIPFRAPNDIRFVNIDAKTGRLPGAETGVIIREAFRKGTEPDFDNRFDDSQSVIFGSGHSGSGVTDTGIFDESLYSIPPAVTSTNGVTPTQPADTDPASVPDDLSDDIY